MTSRHKSPVIADEIETPLTKNDATNK